MFYFILIGFLLQTFKISTCVLQLGIIVEPELSPQDKAFINCLSCDIETCLQNEAKVQGHLQDIQIKKYIVKLLLLSSQIQDFQMHACMVNAIWA